VCTWAPSARLITCTMVCLFYVCFFSSDDYFLFIYFLLCQRCTRVIDHVLMGFTCVYSLLFPCSVPVVVVAPVAAATGDAIAANKKDAPHVPLPSSAAASSLAGQGTPAPQIATFMATAKQDAFKSMRRAIVDDILLVDVFASPCACTCTPACC
jgi:hypothetical protein